MFNFLKTQHIHNKISHEKSRHHRIKLTPAKFGKKEKQKVKKGPNYFGDDSGIQIDIFPRMT
jgi:hypothetical protein